MASRKMDLPRLLVTEMHWEPLAPATDSLTYGTDFFRYPDPSTLLCSEVA